MTIALILKLHNALRFFLKIIQFPSLKPASRYYLSLIPDCAFLIYPPLLLKQLPYFRITSAVRAKKRSGSFHNTSFFSHPITKIERRRTG